MKAEATIRNLDTLNSRINRAHNAILDETHRMVELSDERDLSAVDWADLIKMIRNLQTVSAQTIEQVNSYWNCIDAQQG